MVNVQIKWKVTYAHRVLNLNNTRCKRDSERLHRVRSVLDLSQNQSLTIYRVQTFRVFPQTLAQRRFFRTSKSTQNSWRTIDNESSIFLCPIVTHVVYNLGLAVQRHVLCHYSSDLRIHVGPQSIFVHHISSTSSHSQT